MSNLRPPRTTYDHGLQCDIFFSEFFWSPAENMIAFWVPEQKQIPARVTILAVPSRKEVRVKNLFNATDIRLNWHKLGRYLCVKVDRFSKTKKVSFSTNNALREQLVLSGINAETIACSVVRHCGLYSLQE